MTEKSSKNLPDPGFAKFVNRAMINRYGSSTGFTWGKLPDSGSNRTFYRLRSGPDSLIAVHAPAPVPGINGLDENDSYLYLGRHLRAVGLNVPEIYDHDLKRGYFTVEDMGERTLMAVALESNRDPEVIVPLYEKVLADLAAMQAGAMNGFEPGKIHSPLYTAEQAVERAWGYFKSAFLKGYLGWEEVDEELDREIRKLVEPVDRIEPRVLVYYDFQSSNILIKDGVPGYVDFQAARPGPPQYDVGSLLYDPYVDLPRELRNKLLKYYLKLLDESGIMPSERFLQNYPLLAMMRMLQALGAYGHLVRTKSKSEFEKYIPDAVRGLGDVCEMNIYLRRYKLAELVKKLQL